MRALCWHGKGDVRVDTDPKIQHPRDTISRSRLRDLRRTSISWTVIRRPWRATANAARTAASTHSAARHPARARLTRWSTEAIMCCRKAGTISIPGDYVGTGDKIPLGAAYTAPLLKRIEAGEIDPSFVVTHPASLWKMRRRCTGSSAIRKTASSRSCCDPAGNAGKVRQNVLPNLRSLTGEVGTCSVPARPHAGVSFIRKQDQCRMSIGEIPGMDPLRSIDLVWTLRDIKAKRTLLLPVDPDHLGQLIDLRLVELSDDVPVIPSAGHQVLG